MRIFKLQLFSRWCHFDEEAKGEDSTSYEKSCKFFFFDFGQNRMQLFPNYVWLFISHSLLQGLHNEIGLYVCMYIFKVYENN